MTVVTGEKKRVSVVALIAWGCFALAVFGLAIAAAVALGTSALLENNQPYQDSLAAVRSNPAAATALGEPIEAGDASPDGSLDLENDTGEASL